MLNNLLDIVPGVGENSGNYYFDNFYEPAIYAVMGLAIVFLGIVLLIVLIWAVGLLMRKTNNLQILSRVHPIKKLIELFKGEPSKKQASEPIPQLKNVEMIEESSNDEISDEIKVAIVAALMAYYSKQENKCEFTVKRIKRL